MDNFPKAYREVYEILKYIPKENLEKIPKDFLEVIENNMDKTYAYKIDETKSFEEQEILKETKAIISIIYQDYWATDDRKKELIKIRNKQRETLEQEKREKYSSDIKFKEKEDSEEEKGEELLITKPKQENILVRIVNKIRNWIKGN